MLPNLNQIYPLLLDSLGSLSIGFTFLLIFFAALYIYRRGNLSQVPSLYPALWLYGMAFLMWCGLSRFCEFTEIWSGNVWVYYLTITCKSLTAIFAGVFVVHFVRLRNEFVSVALLIIAAVEVRNETLPLETKTETSARMSE